MLNLKEHYFTPESIREKTGAILRDTAHLHRVNYPAFNLKKAACLVIDMQQWFLDPSSHAFIPSARIIIPNIRKVAALFSTYNRPVFLTRHINSEQDAGSMLRWWGDIIKKDDSLSRLDPELDSIGGQVIFKTQYDAFYQTPLRTILEEQNISQLVITGVMTHLCCETTARSAFVQGFDVFFPVDATADYNEHFHRATVMNLAHGFAVPVSTADLLNDKRNDE